jgi:hypothetical protein
VQAEDLTAVGTLVDLQSYMTGKVPRKDPTKWSRECIRRGVPAALETDGELIVLGMAKGRPAELAEYATKTVRVRGKLYEKGGVKYLEVVGIRVAKPSDHDSGLEGEAYEDLEDEPDEYSEEEPNDEPVEEEPELELGPDPDDLEDSY